jgi:hypothetical protein
MKTFSNVPNKFEIKVRRAHILEDSYRQIQFPTHKVPKSTNFCVNVLNAFVKAVFPLAKVNVITSVIMLVTATHIVFTLV